MAPDTTHPVLMVVPVILHSVLLPAPWSQPSRHPASFEVVDNAPHPIPGSVVPALVPVTLNPAPAPVPVSSVPDSVSLVPGLSVPVTLVPAPMCLVPAQVSFVPVTASVSLNPVPAHVSSTPAHDSSALAHLVQPVKSSIEAVHLNRPCPQPSLQAVPLILSVSVSALLQWSYHF